MMVDSVLVAKVVENALKEYRGWRPHRIQKEGEVLDDREDIVKTIARYSAKLSLQLSGAEVAKAIEEFLNEMYALHDWADLNSGDTIDCLCDWKGYDKATKKFKKKLKRLGLLQAKEAKKDG